MATKLVNIVLNNFTNDSRVLKESLTAQEMGFDVTVCAIHNKGLPYEETVQGIKVVRMEIGRDKMPKGKFFGALIFFRLILL